MNYSKIIDLVRSDFPILNSVVNNKPLIYFDNAATTQKPKAVIEAITKYYTTENSNTHSNHFLATNLTQKIEQIRVQILDFLKADANLYSVIFTKNATEAINLVANSLTKILQPKDIIILTEAEHHANLLPWQRLCQQNNLSLDFIKISQDGNWDLSNLETLLQKPTKIVASSWVSNVLGIINPVQELVAKTNSQKILSLIDATQAIAHLEIDMSQFQPDFLVFSGHKIFAPTGIGVLIVKTSLVEQMETYQVGGEMVKEASLSSSTYQTGYQKFEAGTLNFAEIVGLSASLEYILELKKRLNIWEYEKQLSTKLISNLQSIKNLTIIGNTENKIPLVSFYHKNINSFDLNLFLDLDGIAVRTGQHCAHPLHQILAVDSTTRASLSFYNTEKEIDIFTDSLQKIIHKLS